MTVSGESVSERVGEAISAVDASAVSDVLGMSGSTAMHVGDLKALGLASNWTPVGWIQQALEAITATTGLPWWATIVGATITLRLCIAPLMVHVQGNSIRLANIQPQMQALMGDIQHAKASGDAMEMQKAALKVRKLLSDNDCSPFRSLLLPAVQMPIFVSFFFALRNIAEAGIPSMKIGGFSWITDLTAADPYYVLPILSAGMTLLVLEVRPAIWLFLGH